MLKRIFKSTRITAIVLMALSVVTPVQVAEATGTITKEITVLGTDGNPYVGAIVGMKFKTLSGASQRSNLSSTAVTDSQGKASITFSDAFTGGEINVMPPATDITTAALTDYSQEYANSTPVTVTLKKALLRIQTKTADGQVAPANGIVGNGFDEWTWLIRSGVANISFPNSAPNNTCTEFISFAADAAIGNYRRIFATKLSGSGDTRTVTMYNDPGTCAVETPKVNGVYQLQFNAGNISGNLLSNSGQALSFGQNEGYELDTNAMNSDGTVDWQQMDSFSFVRSDGSFDSFVDTSTAGKYRLAFVSYGNPNYPTFSNKYVWVTSDHKLSWSADGSNPADSLSQNINIPVPNLKFSYIDSATGLNIPVNSGIQKDFGNNRWDQVIGWPFLDGKTSFTLEDGHYQVNARPIGGQGSRLSFFFNVSNGIATFESSNVPTYSYANGTYTVWQPVNNVHLRLKDSSNNPVEGTIDFCTPQNGACYSLQSNSSGVIDGYLPNNTYENIWVNPSNNLSIAMVILHGSVSNGVLAITGKSATAGVFTIELPNANIKFNVTHPTTHQPIVNGWVSFETVDSDWNGNGWAGNANIYGDNPGYARAYLPNGNYLATVSVDTGQSEYAGLADRVYRVTVTNGVATMSLEGTPLVADSDGKFQVSPASANFEATVVNLTGSPISDGWIDVCTDLGNGDTGPCRGYGFNQSGQISQSIANGSWVIMVRPGSTTGMSSKSYSVTVTNGVVSVSGLTKQNGRWILTGTPPNITGSFTLASGSLSFSGNQGISVNLQKYNDNNQNWDWQGNGSWVRSSSYALKVTGAGHYRIVANPVNFSDLVQSYSNEFWVNSSNQVSRTETGTATDSITAFNILLKTPNLKMRIVNPIDSSLLPSGWVTIEKITGQNRNWVGNADIFNQNPGLTGFNLSEVGQYLLTVNPPNGSQAIVGLASRQYQLTVAANDSMTVFSGGVALTPDETGRFVLSPATANVTARIVKADGTPFGSTNGKWVNVNAQKFNADRNSWDWTNTWTNTDQDGYISMRVDAEGLYRLRVEPNGDSDATVTYSSEFTVTSGELNTFKKEFGTITLAGPSIRISVAAPGDPSTVLNFANIEIRKDGNWLDWANTNRSGIAGISLKTAGTYEFVVHPTNGLQGTTSRKSYKITATADSEGVVTATAVSGSGVSVANGVTKLLLGTPTLSGTVKEPGTSTNVVANAQVVAVNSASGQEMWEYSANTNSSGVWAMSLPAGKYKIKARAPWGSSTFGDSDLSNEITVSADGTTTDSNAQAFLVRLKDPTWSGTVKQPGTSTTVVPNARVCLALNFNWNCTNADANGAWALSAPSTFTNFTGTNPLIEIADDFGRQYPLKRIEGESAVNSAIGLSGTNKTLRFDDANTQITVTAGGNPVANVWVSAERDGSGWLGGGTTNASGVAKLNIASPSTSFKVRVELNGNPTISSNYASTMKTFTNQQISDGTSGGVFNGTVALAEPNFKVALLEPTTDGSVGNAIPYSWIELYSDTTGTWLGGASTDANGFASFKLDAPNSGINNYTVTVNPAWNASTNYSRQAYAVAVSPSAITVVNKTTNNAVNTQTISGRTGIYPLTLGTPSITGVVVDPNNATVANSWVVPRDAVTSEYYWQQGVNSRRNGEIAINLASGQYTLEANVPWGTSNVAKSASCAVTVANGTISTGGACVQDGATKTVRLALRAPNVTFTLKIGGVAVANANVGMGSGKWYTNAQSDSEGKVSLFIDAPAIRAANNYTTAQPLFIWVDPPYGGSVEMARWDCTSTQSKPICSGLANVPATGDYPTTALGDVTGMAPNTRIKVVAPGTSTEMPNSWVTVFAFDPNNANNGRRWLGGANSNSSGYASMNLETSTVPSSWRFSVEINAPWNQRQSYAANYDDNSGSGFTWAQLIGGLVKSPKSPNLTVTVNAANAVANKFGWIGVEEVNGSDVPQAWVGGYGLNENGISSIFLASSKRFKITSYPGQGRSGARTTCIVTTNGSGVVSLVAGKCDAGTPSTAAVAITLDGGNIVGRVTRASDSTPVVGAIVYANIPNAPDESTAVITSTDADGRYALQLEPGQTWNIKVFPVGTDKTALRTDSANGVTPPSSGSASRNFSIAAA